MRYIKNLRLDSGRVRNSAKFLSLAFVLLLVPLAASAVSDQTETKVTVEPLSNENSKKLAENLSKFQSTQIETKKIEIKVKEPEPQPEPVAPEPPKPVVVTKKAKKITTRVASSKKIKTGKNVVGTSYEQCVPFARELSGVQIRGYAGNIRPNAYEPKVGAVALTSGVGHAAVVTGVSGDSVTIKEANWVPGKITERTIPRDSLRGYVY